MNEDQMLQSILEELESGKKCILLHVNADPDALGSAVALSIAFPETSIGTAGGLSKNAKSMQRNLDIEVIQNPDITLYDKVVVVDTPSPERLPGYAGKLKSPIVIDHHLPTSHWKTGLVHIDDTKTSCGEIIYEILKIGGKIITRKMGLALLAGILTDTGKFSYANSSTLRTFSQILEQTGLGMEEVLNLFEEAHETDYSKRISRLKGAQRLRYVTVKGSVVAITQVSSFESSVCSALLFLGSDVAFVGSQRDCEFRISARANATLVNSGLHLGNLLAQIGNEMGYEGGGHVGAAGMTGSGDVEAILNICQERAKEAISGILDKVQR